MIKQIPLLHQNADNRRDLPNTSDKEALGLSRIFNTKSREEQLLIWFRKIVGDTLEIDKALAPSFKPSTVSQSAG